MGHKNLTLRLSGAVLAALCAPVCALAAAPLQIGLAVPAVGSGSAAAAAAASAGARSAVVGGVVSSFSVGPAAAPASAPAAAAPAAAAASAAALPAGPAAAADDDAAASGARSSQARGRAAASETHGAAATASPTGRRDLETVVADGDGSGFDGSTARTGTASAIDYGHGRAYTLLRQSGLITSHRKGLFRNRAEKYWAYLSIPTAAGAASLAGYRIAGGALPGVLAAAFGGRAPWILTLFLAPIGFAAVGYLVALGCALLGYKMTAPDLRSGDLVRKVAAAFPLLGLTASILLFSGPAATAAASAAVLGAAIAGFAGAAAMMHGLWKPYANRKVSLLTSGFMFVTFPTLFAILLPQLLVSFAVPAGLAAAVPAVLAAASLLAGVRSLHESSKKG